MTADPRRRGRWRGSGTLAAPTAAGPEAAAPAPAAGAVPAPVVGLASRPAARRVAAWRRPGPKCAPGPAVPAAVVHRRGEAEEPVGGAGRATSEWTRPTGCAAKARVRWKHPNRRPLPSRKEWSCRPWRAGCRKTCRRVACRAAASTWRRRPRSQTRPPREGAGQMTDRHPRRGWCWKVSLWPRGGRWGALLPCAPWSSSRGSAWRRHP